MGSGSSISPVPVPAPAPVRVRRGSGVPLRLAACLAMLHACGHAVCETTDGGYGANAGVERGTAHAEAMDEAAGKGAEWAAVHGDGTFEGDGGGAFEGDGGVPGPPVTALGKAPAPVGERAAEAGGGAGAADVVAGQVGECSGRRFKKCR